MSRRRKSSRVRVVIAVPLATPWIYWRTVAAILEMERPFESDLMVFQGALVDRARNQLIGQMLGHPMEPTHLLFLDADIVPPADTLMQLLETDKPILSGLYRRRLPPYEPMAFQFGGARGRLSLHPIPIKGSRLREVDAVGAGCLLIRREVFERVEPPWFNSEWTEEGHLSEDFSFCRKAKEAGFDIYVDTSVRPAHLEPMGIGTSPNGSLSFVPVS